MHKTFTYGALYGLTALLLAASGARAQPAAAPATLATPPAAAPAAAVPAAPPPLSHGPLVPGVCLLSHEALVTRSKVGQAAITRLQDLTGQVRTNLTAEGTRVDARIKALEEKRATLTQLQYQAQGQALMQRRQALQAQAQDRSQQLEATKTRAFNAVLEEAQPYVMQAYGAHGCGLLFAREAVFTGNLGNDLTDEVLIAFDAKGTPITFDLEPPHSAH